MTIVTSIARVEASTVNITELISGYCFVNCSGQSINSEDTTERDYSLVQLPVGEAVSQQRFD